MSGKPVDFGASFNFAIERFKASPKDMIVFCLLALVATIILMLPLIAVSFAIPMAIGKEHPILTFLILTPFQWVLGALAYGVCLGALLPPFFNFIDKSAQGLPSDFLAELKNQSCFKNAFVAAFVSYVFIAIGSLFCVIPGILISPILPISVFLVWKGDNGFGAVKKSFSALIANPLGCLFILIMTIAGGLGALLCLVGVLVTMPASYAGCWHICKQMFSEIDEATTT